VQPLAHQHYQVDASDAAATRSSSATSTIRSALAATMLAAAEARGGRSEAAPD
jgi:hypothetical protein